MGNWGITMFYCRCLHKSHKEISLTGPSPGKLHYPAHPRGRLPAFRSREQDFPSDPQQGFRTLLISMRPGPPLRGKCTLKAGLSEGTESLPLWPDSATPLGWRSW